MHSAPNTHTQKNQTLKPECLHRQQVLMHQLLHITLLPRERMCPCTSASCMCSSAARTVIYGYFPAV